MDERSRGVRFRGKNRVVNTANKASMEPATESAESVAAYLRSHPQFFEEHPDVLASLSVPHETGAAASLLERQALQLRRENRDLKRRLQSLIAVARENEALSRKLHALTLRLIHDCEPAQLLETLCAGLGEDFNADRVLVRIFADPARARIAFPEVVGATAPERRLLEDLVSEGSPFCGRLKRAHIALVFEAEQAEPGSAVVLPLGGPGWQGLLVVASGDPCRYRADMGVELLAHMADVTSLVIAPWIDGA